MKGAIQIKLIIIIIIFIITLIIVSVCACVRACVRACVPVEQGKTEREPGVRTRGLAGPYNGSERKPQIAKKLVDFGRPSAPTLELPASGALTMGADAGSRSPKN